MTTRYARGAASFDVTLEQEVPVVLAFLTACAAPDYGLASVDPLAIGPDLAPTADLGDGAAFAAWTSAPLTSPGLPAAEGGATEAAKGIARVEAFALGPAPSPVADFLFVIDESISMRRALDRLDAGLGSLLAPGVFPTGSRIAVLNMTPADPDDPTSPHPAVPPAGDDDLTPGFGALIDAPRIATYRGHASGRYAKEYTSAGCAAWFAPEAVDPNGVPCLFVHTRVPFLPKRAEAGLVALGQWLDRADRPRFRAGAAVNVIFLSDTHDPGLRPEKLAALGELGADLLALQPDFAALRDRVTEPVSAFRVHAIAPETTCGEPWAAPSYFDVVDAAGGVRADFCTTEDYADVIAAIAQVGARPQEPVLRLGYPAAQVEAVLGPDGPIAWSTTEDPQAVTLAGDLPDRLTRVHVRYRTR